MREKRCVRVREGDKFLDRAGVIKAGKRCSSRRAVVLSTN